MLTALIVAAGQSRRMAGLGDKIMLPLLGQPLITHTLQPFCRSTAVEQIIIVTASELIGSLQRLVLSLGMEKVTAIIPGGSTRQQSVAYGLASLSSASDMVAIHDGARPCLGDAELQAVIDAAQHNGAAMLAVPVKDTIKRVRDGVEVETPERSQLYHAQTPQVFRRQVIVNAHERAAQLEITATDDAALVTALGQAVAVVPGKYSNIKVTTPEDLALAELFLVRRQV